VCQYFRFSIIFMGMSFAPDQKINSFFHELRDEDLSLWYKGVFDDMLTNSIIELGNYNTGEHQLGKSKKRVSFLMAESFQNIVRHGFKSLDNSIRGTFGICNREGLFHIFSSNRISQEERESIRQKLEKVNQMDPAELKEMYRSILMAGTLSEKGGAGLGLIEMVRKSKRPLQYNFIEKNGFTDFALQIDLEVNQEIEPASMKIEEALRISEALEKCGSIILFKGDFKEDSTSHVLNVMLRNTDLATNATKTDKLIFHAGVEMLQNISRHGAEADGVIEGVFELGQLDNRVRVSAQNLVSVSDKNYLHDILSEINSKSDEELNGWYKQQLKKSVLEDTKFAGVGLIDLGRCSNGPIAFQFEEIGEHFLFTITVYFEKQ
jgi:hypothetical protein